MLVAMANPTNVLTIDDIGMMTGRRVRPAAASIEDLNLLLSRLVRMDESIEEIVDDDEGGEEDLQLNDADATRRSSSSCTRSSHRRFSRARRTSTSTPEEGDTHVMFRVDGVLTPAATVKRRMSPS